MAQEPDQIQAMRNENPCYALLFMLNEVTKDHETASTAMIEAACWLRKIVKKWIEDQAIECQDKKALSHCLKGFRISFSASWVSPSQDIIKGTDDAMLLQFAVFEFWLISQLNIYRITQCDYKPCSRFILGERDSKSYCDRSCGQMARDHGVDDSGRKRPYRRKKADKPWFEKLP